MMQAQAESDEENQKDTSLPGREEEIIVNTDIQKQTTNSGQLPACDDQSYGEATGSAGLESIVEFLSPTAPYPSPKNTFKEGLSDNSNTDHSTP